jgi:transcriptional regulator with XRE-family HTH domain
MAVVVGTGDNVLVRNSTRLGMLVKARRESRGLTMKELGALVGASRTAIDAIENGRTKLPGPDLLRGLAKELGLTRVELLVAAEYLSEDEARGPIEASSIKRAEEALERALAGLRQATTQVESVERDVEAHEEQARHRPRSVEDPS